jgi:hypothetical protein
MSVDATLKCKVVFTLAKCHLRNVSNNILGLFTCLGSLGITTINRKNLLIVAMPKEPLPDVNTVNFANVNASLLSPEM